MIRDNADIDHDHPTGGGGAAPRSWASISDTGQQIIGGILGGVVGGLLGLIVGHPVEGAIAGASLGANLVSGGQDAYKNQANAEHEQQVMEQAAADAEARKALERQNQQIAYQNTVRNAEAENASREADVNSANENSRKAAIQAYQQKSSGEAAEAQSGVSAGTPYMSLESQVNETKRQIDVFWQGVSAKIKASELGQVTGMEESRMNYRASDLNQTILGHQVENYNWEADKYAEEASDTTLWKNIGAVALNSLVTSWNTYTTIGAIDIGLKRSGLGNGKNLFEASSDFIKNAPAYKWAQLSGDWGVFDDNQKTTSANTTYNGGGLVVDSTPLQYNTFNYEHDSKINVNYNSLSGMRGFDSFDVNKLTPMDQSQNITASSLGILGYGQIAPNSNAMINVMKPLNVNPYAPVDYNAKTLKSLSALKNMAAYNDNNGMTFRGGLR